MVRSQNTQIKFNRILLAFVELMSKMQATYDGGIIRRERRYTFLAIILHSDKRIIEYLRSVLVRAMKCVHVMYLRLKREAKISAGIAFYYIIMSIFV